MENFKKLIESDVNMDTLVKATDGGAGSSPQNAPAGQASFALGDT